MKQITFHCETITPMFLAGADGKTPELRPSAVKGALRFWWRALNPQLVDKGQDGKFDYSRLREKEGEIFGDTERKSKLKIYPIDGLVQESSFKPVPHKNFKLNAYKPGQRFIVNVTFTENDNYREDFIKSFFLINSWLGGLGKRVRRGMGSFQITNINEEPANEFSLDNLLKDLNNITNNYARIDNNTIELQTNSNIGEYPFIKKIEIGKNYKKPYDLLLKISKTTQDLHKYKDYKYSLGFTYKGERFSSPIFVSVVKQGNVYMPIITTLNTSLREGWESRESQLELQEKFKEKI